jgi:hypothetical protein
LQLQFTSFSSSSTTISRPHTTSTSATSGLLIRHANQASILQRLLRLVFRSPLLFMRSQPTGLCRPSKLVCLISPVLVSICSKRFQFGWFIHILPTCRSLARCRVCQNIFNIIFFLFNTIRLVIVSVSQSLAHRNLKDLILALIVVQEKLQYSCNITTNRHETHNVEL